MVFLENNFDIGSIEHMIHAKPWTSLDFQLFVLSHRGFGCPSISAPLMVGTCIFQGVLNGYRGFPKAANVSLGCSGHLDILSAASLCVVNHFFSSCFVSKTSSEHYYLLDGSQFSFCFVLIF
jgi:hypothetical protein